MFYDNALFTEQCKVVLGQGPKLPVAATLPYVSLKGYRRLIVIINVLNATTVTGFAVSLKQATDVGGAGIKTLGFTKVRQNIDAAASDTLVDTDVSSNTFTTDATNSKNLQYVIEVRAEDLDINNSFDCVAVAIAAGAAATVAGVTYILEGASTMKSTPPTAVAN